MADAEERQETKDTVNPKTGEKRKSTEALSDAAPEKKKINISFGKLSGVGAKKPNPPAPIKMSVAPQKPETTNLVKASAAVAQAFNDDDSDEEEMPPEARMRMRNIGRDTPTAAGPNSFGKNRLGFCDHQKIIERELQKNIESTND